MDRYDSMRLFNRVVERKSFTLASQDLKVPRSTVTDVIKQLEARLGTRLLQRTTRRVSPTLDGEAFYRRSLTLVAELEEAENVFRDVKPRGLLRVDVQGTLARHFVLPRLPAFLETYPQLELLMTEGDRLVDLVQEGVDCVVRVGALKDSELVARKLATLEELTCASPAYLKRYGQPRSPDRLEGHRMVGFRSSVTGSLFPLEFLVGKELRTVILPATLSVNGAESFVGAARLGLGLIQVPRYHAAADLESGALVQVLKKYPPSPTPVSLLYPRSRQLSPRVRVFMEWLVQAFQ